MLIGFFERSVTAEQDEHNKIIEQKMRQNKPFSKKYCRVIELNCCSHDVTTLWPG